MNLFKKNDDREIKSVVPNNLGWLEKKLSSEEMDYLWRCINNRGKSTKKYLVGQIRESNDLNDKSDWFFINTLKPLILEYSKRFSNLGGDMPVIAKHPYCLHNMWVNFQRKNEFNPTHDHKGVYSFVVWMKIPTKHSEQARNPVSCNAMKKVISKFQFSYINTIGDMCFYDYEMDPEVEGTLLFFPSKLHHCVYPFYNCDEERISISGNISINTAKVA
tara:strand:+ start:73 stop:726 length:654 start_codon:yes stop_codon:yes gene_type:complete